MPEQTIDGTSFYYREEGSGPSLVLVHGFPLDHRVWEAQVDSLRDCWRVIAPDLRGFGRSRSEQAFSIASLADDLHRLLARIEAVPCVLGGLSMGGYVAFAFLTKYASDLSGLVLVDTRSEADAPEGKQGRMKMIETVRAGGARAVADEMMPKMLHPETAKRRPEVAERLRAIMESCPPQTIEHALLAMRDREDYGDKLASIAVPTLLLVGEADAITPPAMAQGIKNEIPHAKLCIIRGAGHMTPMEQPGEVSAALRQFVECL